MTLNRGSAALDTGVLYPDGSTMRAKEAAMAALAAEVER